MNLSRVRSGKWIDTLMHNAYNPPVFTNDFTEYEFDEEYYEIRQRCIEALESLGGKHSYKDGDFWFNETRGSDSRWLSVELTSVKLWRPKTLPFLQRTLLDVPHDYMIYISHEIITQPLFHILVNQREALGWGSGRTLKRFGFGERVSVVKQ